MMAPQQMQQLLSPNQLQALIHQKQQALLLQQVFMLKYIGIVLIITRHCTVVKKRFFL